MDLDESLASDRCGADHRFFRDRIGEKFLREAFDLGLVEIALDEIHTGRIDPAWGIIKPQRLHLTSHRLPFWIGHAFSGSYFDAVNCGGGHFKYRNP